MYSTLRKAAAVVDDHRRPSTGRRGSYGLMIALCHVVKVVYVIAHDDPFWMENGGELTFFQSSLLLLLQPL